MEIKIDMNEKIKQNGEHNKNYGMANDCKDI